MHSGSKRFLATWTVAAIVLGATGSHAADWTLGRQEDGITVHTRPVEGSGIDEFRGVAEVDAPAEAIVALLRDSNRFKDWFPNTPESRLLDRNGAVSHQYSVMATPWPVSDRDNVLRSVLSRDTETGVVEITVTADPDHYPEQPDRVRVRRANGLWRFEPLSESRTRVTFQMHLEPGGGIPQWMINARVVATPFEALGNLREMVAR
ncbi:MAG: START domain-containing protein [bacterium]|nr:START domain-containing protein [bacterium]